MRAIAIQEFGGTERMKLMDLPRPKPARGEILIHTVAAGVNPVDAKIREGKLKDALPHKFPVVLGWDVAGIIEEMGEGVSKFRKGEKVWAYARKPVIQWGTWAEYVTVPEGSAALLPPRLLFEEAAAVPLAALTAYQSIRKANVRNGETVLIHAAAGGVGHFAVQFAKNAGAKVFGTAGPTNQEFVLGMGADHAIDYTREDFRESVRRLSPDGVNVVIDCVGGSTLTSSIDILSPGGRLIALVDRPSPSDTEGRNVRAEYHFVEPNGDQLEIFATLFPRGKLRTHVSKIHPLQEAQAALGAVEAGHVRGKLVLAL